MTSRISISRLLGYQRDEYTGIVFCWDITMSRIFVVEEMEMNNRLFGILYLQSQTYIFNSLSFLEHLTSLPDFFLLVSSCLSVQTGITKKKIYVEIYVLALEIQVYVDK